MSEPGNSPAEAPKGPLPSWKQLWQVPALVLSAGLLVSALSIVTSKKSSPPIDGYLTNAAKVLESRDYQGTLDYLNEHLLGFQAAGKLSPAQEARYQLLLARAMYFGQRELRVSVAENHAKVLAGFIAAREGGAGLTALDESAVAETLLALGRTEEALRAARALPPSENVRRLSVFHAAIESMLQTRASDRTLVMELLSEYLQFEGLKAEDRIWAASRQARALIDQGYADAAINKLLRELQRFGSAAPGETAPMLVMLAEAYLETGVTDQADRLLERVERETPPGHELRPRVMLLRGGTAQARGEYELARDRFRAVVDDSPHSDEVVPGLLGLGETEAVLGSGVASLEAFTRLVAEMNAGRRHPGVSIEQVTASLLARSREQRERDELQSSLEFAILAERLHAPGKPPGEVYQDISIAHRALARSLMGAGDEAPAGRVTLAQLDPASREEARRHLIAAGAYARRHAESVAVSDNAAYGDSIWAAADDFDLAGDVEEAIASFQEFVNSFPDDVRRAEGRFRLAQAFQARGEYTIAADFYRGLIEDRNNRDVKGVGPFADASYVPLAQVLRLDADMENDAEAEKLLLAVVSGSVIVDPSARAFRDALLELARHYAQSGQHPQAIERCEEFLGRFPSDPEALLVRYRLAENLRRSAADLQEELRAGLPDSRRQVLEGERDRRLATALETLSQVIEELEARDPRRRSRLETDALRNAYFYRGSSAYDLGDYEAAIRYYDAAYDRYPEDPASLVALVQIVNAHVQMGNIDRARVSNERARRFFESLPDSAWNDPFLPMGRADWERWLESSSKLYATGEEDQP